MIANLRRARGAAACPRRSPSRFVRIVRPMTKVLNPLIVGHTPALFDGRADPACGQTVGKAYVTPATARTRRRS